MYDLLYTDINKIKYKDKIYNLNIAFNRVLKAIDLLKNKDYLDNDKINFCLDIFIEGKVNLDISEKNQLLTKIFKEFIEQDNEKPNKNEKVMDIKKDFGYIYSSFMKDYNIDLIDEMDKLHWIKFIYLLQGLSKDTKMISVINIRTMKIPKATKYNSEERQKIIEMKRQYALQEQENFQDGLNNLFKVLKGMAGGA